MSDANKATPKDSSGGLQSWFKGIMAEYKLIVWPKKSDLINMTMAVLVTCFLFGILIVGMDTVFSFLYKGFIDLVA